MSQTYTIAYRLYREDGSIYDEATADDPLIFAEEDEVIIDGFRTALLGMTAGESRRVTIAPEEGFGPYRQDLVFEVEPDTLPPGIKVGEKITGFLDGEEAELTVIGVAATAVTLNANHSLAGETLILELTLLTPGT